MKSVLLFPFFLLIWFHAISQLGYDAVKLSQMLQVQDYENAITYLNSLSAENENNSTYNSDLGYAYFLNGQYQEAGIYFNKVINSDSQNVKANLYLAQIAIDQKDWEAALYHYLMLVKAQPTQYRFWDGAGDMFKILNETDSAFVYYAKSNELNRRSVDVLLNYVGICERKKLIGKADSLLDDFLLSIDSSNIRVVGEKVEVSSKRGNNKATIHWGEKLLKDSVDVFIPYLYLAYAYLNSNRYEDARNLCEWLMLTDKGTPDILYCAAIAESKMNNYNESNFLLDDCIYLALSKDLAKYYNLKSDNYEALKNYTTAVKYYDTSYYMLKKPLDIYNAGRIYDLYLKNKARAYSYYNLYRKKQKAPQSIAEVEIFKYVDEWLREYKQ